MLDLSQTSEDQLVPKIQMTTSRESPVDCFGANTFHWLNACLFKVSCTEYMDNQQTPYAEI